MALSPTTSRGANPLTTKGDLFGYDTAAARIPIGSDTQLLTADSTQSLGLKWAAAPASGALTLLSTTTLASDGTFDVSSISQAYNDLYIILIARGTRAATADFLQLRLNNDSGANYDGEITAGNGSSVSASLTAGGTSARISGGMPAASATANLFGIYHIEIDGYTSTTWKKAIKSVAALPITAGSSLSDEMSSGIWHSTAAVNRVGFFGGTTANLLTGSVLRIYGRL